MGLEHLRQHKPSIDDGDIQRMKTQYGNLEKILLEVDERVRTSARELLQFITLLSVLIPLDMHRTPLHVHEPNPFSTSTAA